MQPDITDIKTPPSLPEWIPCGADAPYLAAYTNGGYSDKRKAEAIENLFHSDKLRSVWEGSLGKLFLSSDGWSYLVRLLIFSLECAPPPGVKRATADRPSRKHEIMEQQKKVDKLLAGIAEKARELSDLLIDLAENGGEIPAETYSGMVLIESSIESNSMARACCSNAFNEFRRGLSSYEEGFFPLPVSIIERLANACDEQPVTQDLFYADPWLSSNQSSWKDYVRVVKEGINNLKLMSYQAPNLSDADWTALCQVLLNLPDLTRQAVTKGLKEL